MGPFKVQLNINGAGWTSASTRVWSDGYNLDSLKTSLISQLEAQGMVKISESGYSWTMTFKTSTIVYRIVDKDGQPV